MVTRLTKGRNETTRAGCFKFVGFVIGACGEFRFQIDVIPLNHFREKLDRTASRLALSVVFTALNLGSVIVMSVEIALYYPVVFSSVCSVLVWQSSVVCGCLANFDLARGAAQVTSAMTFNALKQLS